MPLTFLDEFRDPALAARLVERIREAGDGDAPVRIMEVCGTHTTAIARGGIRSLLEGRAILLSGPGCPVCVTPEGYVDAAIALGEDPRVILATFGDMVRVPGARSSLEKERGRGTDVRVVYSPLDAVALAGGEPDREVVFLGVGFETTAPAIAGAIATAGARGLSNFSVLSSIRTIPGAMALLAADPEVRVDAFLCPAHVSAIIGTDAYRPLAERSRLPCVVAGFEPLDILSAILLILRQRRGGEARVENEYARVATATGNRKAQALIAGVFEPVDAEWRGIGTIPGSGLAISEAYGAFDARRKFGVAVRTGGGKAGCRCGDVLKGKVLPSGCPLFGKACTPQEPAGPCMVSGEGACSAHYRYGVRG